MGDVVVDLSEVGPLYVLPCLLSLLLSSLFLFLPSMPYIAIYLYLPHRGITLTWWCGLIPFGVTNDPFFFEKINVVFCICIFSSVLSVLPLHLCPAPYSIHIIPSKSFAWLSVSSFLAVVFSFLAVVMSFLLS